MMKFPEKGLRVFLSLLGFAIILFVFKGCAGSPYPPDGSRDEEYSVYGRWLIDTDASAAYARKSPRWTEEDEASAGMVLGMMSERYFLIFKPGVITIEERGISFEIPVSLIESSDGTHVYRGEVLGVEAEFRAAFADHGKLNLRTSLTDDLGYILWKRDD